MHRFFLETIGLGLFLSHGFLGKGKVYSTWWFRISVCIVCIYQCIAK